MAACGDTRDTVGGSQETAIDSVAESSSEESDSSENQTDADGTEDSGQGGAPEGSGTIVVTGMDAAGEPIEVTVPYKPERVVVLDLANLDILDNLGLGGCVVGAPTITLPYLQSYNDELPIVGSVKTPDLEAVMACEPDLILMGGRMAEYMDSLGEIAPVLRLTTVSDEGLVEAIRANAQTVGAIFGETEHVDELLAQYDAQIAALAEFAQGKTCVLGMSTSGSFNLLGNDGRCSLIVNEIGFDNIGVDAAAAGSDSGRSGGHGSRDEGNEEESSGRSGSGEGSEGEGSSESGNDASGSAGVTPTHGNEVSFEAIVALNPDYIFVMDRDSAISATGAQLAQEIMENEMVMKTDAYRNGNLVILENPGIWYLAEGGITSLGIMLSDLEKALLD
ncbi:siderophore ABC transporter substrate-binding protein [uncultured Acetatifactor sp.]|uniref:siderophore ABC transporter substrate-binding protein n=1 Tax=uncultured Acetatifactor sp. TaxID=1671927 RepID=UPI00261E93F7|nr:ABC transporter substrate-binding protein [uncultured Acetatifactor sp.]